MTIVHTRRGMLLTKQNKAWRELQDRYEDYMASLGPYSLDELMEYLAIEYPKSPPFAPAEVEAFLADPDESVLWAR